MGAHVWDYHARDALPRFGLNLEDIDNSRNGLPLCSTIEKAFDRSRVCFFYNPVNKDFIFFVLDPSLMKQVAKPSSFKFEDLHEQVVQFPNSNRPFHRLITYLAADAIQEALSKKNWIVPENHAKFQSFVDISIDSLTRDDERVNINQSTNSRFGDVESS